MFIHGDLLRKQVLFSFQVPFDSMALNFLGGLLVAIFLLIFSSSFFVHPPSRRLL